MSTTTINTHLGGNIEWIVYRNGHNEFQCALTLNSVAYDISSLPFTVYFRTPGGTSDKLTLIEEAGSVVNGGATGLLTIPLTEAKILASLPRDMYFMVIEYISASKTYPLAQGYVKISDETNPGTTTTTTTIPVNIAGVTVSMAVTLPGGGGGAWGDITGTLSDQTDLQSALDAKVAQTITDGVATSAPSQDAVFDALALKQDTITASNGLTKTGNDIALGGSLTKNTSINLGDPYQLSFEWVDDGFNGDGSLKIGVGFLEIKTFVASDPTQFVTLNASSGELLFTDNKTLKNGFRYAASGYATDPKSLVPKEDVIGLQDLYIGAVAMWPRTTGGCAALAKTELATSLVNIQSLDFDQTTQEFAQFTIALPRNWNNGTVTAKFYWTAGSGSGDVQWGISGGAYSNDDALTVALGTAMIVNDTLITANDLHITSETNSITLAGSPADADFLAFQISRNPASDTLSADAKLLGVVITLTTDSGVAA